MYKKLLNKLKIVSIITLLIMVAGVGAFFLRFKDELLDSLSAIYASVLVNLANKDRTNQNLSELKVNPLLERAAQMKADDMAERGYFAHNTPEGLTPWYWVERAGYKYKYAGENLAVNFLESEEVHSAWAASPTHWLNIVSPRYTEIGIATSTGFYKGYPAIFVVQMFGTPR